MCKYQSKSSPFKIVETIIGSKVAGQGVSYVIHFYGSQTLTPILPWIQ